MRSLLPVFIRVHLLFLLFFCFHSPTALAQVITLDRPRDREFIVDKADLIKPADEQTIRTLADKLLTDTASPIVVVTIESMAKYNSRGINAIEKFAKVLFDQWAIGQLTVNDRPSNTGILLLVSRDDRKARIELGTGWPYDKDYVAQQIMNDVMVPSFKRGDFSGGITSTVRELDQLARGAAVNAAASGGSAPGGPTSSPPPPSRYSYPGSGSSSGGSRIGLPCCGMSAVGLIVVFFLIRMMGGMMGRLGGGSYRRGPGFGGGLLGGMLLGGLLGGGRSSQGSGWGGGWSGGGGFSGGGGGGFSGGSFGGGFSGGHGASGSW